MIESLNKTIQTTLRRRVTTIIFSDNIPRNQSLSIFIGNRYQSNSQISFLIDFYRLASEIEIHLRLISIIGLSFDYAWYMSNVTVLGPVVN